MIEKILNAQKIHVINDFVVCGGVSANSYLRQKLLDLKDSHDIKSYLPNVCYSTDNAAMIGAAALFRLKFRPHESSLKLGISGRLPIDQANTLYEKNPPF